MREQRISRWQRAFPSVSVQLRSKEDAAQLSWKDIPCLLSSGLLPAAFDRGGGPGRGSAPTG